MGNNTEFRATVEDMISAQKNERCTVTIETPQLKSVHKGVLVSFDGGGIRIYKEHTPAKGDAVIYPQGRINKIALEDECKFMLSSKSWFMHGEDNLTLTIK